MRALDGSDALMVPLFSFISFRAPELKLLNGVSFFSSFC